MNEEVNEQMNEQMNERVSESMDELGTSDAFADLRHLATGHAMIST